MLYEIQNQNLESVFLKIRHLTQMQIQLTIRKISISIDARIHALPIRIHNVQGALMLLNLGYSVYVLRYVRTIECNTVVRF